MTIAWLARIGDRKDGRNDDYHELRIQGQMRQNSHRSLVSCCIGGTGRPAFWVAFGRLLAGTLFVFTRLRLREVQVSLATGSGRWEGSEEVKDNWHCMYITVYVAY